VEYRRLGRSGLLVSPICLGAMMFGERTDQAEAARIVASAREAGVNFIDTADVYAKGESERVVGRLVAGDRDRWVIATKVGSPTGGGPDGSGTGRRPVLRAIDGSLARLGTDHVDIYYLHRDDEATPLEETLGAMADVIAAGKARYFGLSNFRGWRVAEVANACERMGIAKPVACQPYYSALNRQAEADLLPACHHHGIGIVTYSPLARGVLTGKYAVGEAPAADTRAGRGDKRIAETEWRPESLEIAREIAAHARARGVDAADFALAWVLNNRLVTSAIAGPRTDEQWEAYQHALEFAFSAEDEAFVNGLVAAGHASTPGFNDPSHPVEGRVSIVAPAPVAAPAQARQVA